MRVENETVMNRYNETFETWNKLATLYQDKFMDIDIYNKTYDVIAKSITKKKAKILEIGCGPGIITKFLLSKRPDYDILGIDIAQNMVELAKKNNPNARFEIMDSRRIDEIKTRFDGIVCGFCLPYLSQIDSRKLIFDCFNLLNVNGLLYISFVEGDPVKSGFQISSTGDRSYFYYHTLDDLTNQLIEKKFDNLKISRVEYNKPENIKEIHTIVIAKKSPEIKFQGF